MPELPEVETVRRSLEPELKNKSFSEIIFHRSKLRYPLSPHIQKLCEGQKIIALKRRAKYLEFHFANKAILIAHLGMTGNFRFSKETVVKPMKHDHVVLSLAHKSDSKDTHKPSRHLIFSDSRRFGFFLIFANQKELETQKFYQQLGPEPWDVQLESEFHSCLQQRKQEIKQSIMDQTLLVGVGNIYASESLFLAGISPFRKANDLTKKESVSLLQSIRLVLEAAIQAGGSTLKDFKDSTGETGYFQHEFRVYDREGEPCPFCRCDKKKRGVIEKAVQGGRSTYFCAKGQK
jgi:formamidopyrimidine-DNA glycosylase